MAQFQDDVHNVKAKLKVSSYKDCDALLLFRSIYNHHHHHRSGLHFVLVALAIASFQYILILILTDSVSYCFVIRVRRTLSTIE